MKTAIVLFNLGGPDKLENVEPFLFNLFNDSAIINLPKIFRHIIAKIISKRRAPVTKKIYKKIGGSSPILELTNKQAELLEKKLNDNIKNYFYKCFVVMRYWHPRAQDVVKNVIEYNPDEIILLPLYPQFSAATSFSSFKEWEHEWETNGKQIITKKICCYPSHKGFIDAHILLINKTIKDLNNTDFHLIFSAHGLPEKNIKKGDPYQWQVEQTVDSIIKNMNNSSISWSLSYQSKVGPLKWIGPSTKDEIKRICKNKKNIIIVPIAFVSDHSETLVELDIEYRKLAEQNGCKIYKRVPALGVNQEFIDSLADIIEAQNNYDNFTMIIHPSLKCPDIFKNCPCSKNFKDTMRYN